MLDWMELLNKHKGFIKADDISSFGLVSSCLLHHMIDIKIDEIEFNTGYAIKVIKREDRPNA